MEAELESWLAGRASTAERWVAEMGLLWLGVAPPERRAGYFSMDQIAEEQEASW